MSEPFCKACHEVGMIHCAHPEECKTPEELAAWDNRPRRDCSFRCAICDDGLRACTCAYGHHNAPIRTVQTRDEP